MMHSDSHLYSGHVHAVSTAFHGNCNLRERAVEGNDALRNSHLYAMMHSEIATCMPTIMLYQIRQCNFGNGIWRSSQPTYQLRRIKNKCKKYNLRTKQATAKPGLFGQVHITLQILSKLSDRWPHSLVNKIREYMFGKKRLVIKFPGYPKTFWEKLLTWFAAKILQENIL